MSEQIKVVWLGSYRLALLQPEICWVRRPKGEHSASWIVNLTSALAERGDVDLQIIMASSGIKQNQTIRKDGITCHIVCHTFPFTLGGFPNYMRLDLVSRYAFLRKQVKNIILELRPDLSHVHGTESCYGLAALDTNLPIVSIQGIVNFIKQISPSTSGRLQSYIKLDMVRKTKYLASRAAWPDYFIRGVNNTATIYNLPEAVNGVSFNTVSTQCSQNILMVGQILPRKGIEEAVDAISIVTAACPSAKLLVVGEGTHGAQTVGAMDLAKPRDSHFEEES